MTGNYGTKARRTAGSRERGRSFMCGVRHGQLCLCVLLVVCQIVAAQDEVTSVPSLLPPAPTVLPTVAETMPTVTPTSLPGTTSSPSLPSTSPSPSLADAPSVSPTQTPPAPTDRPTVSDVLVGELFNINLTLDGFPSLLMNETNSTWKQWESITADHVRTYWRQRNYSDFNVSTVSTLFANQLFRFGQQPNATSNETRRSAIIYGQQVQYSVNGSNSPVDDQNETESVKILMFRPFTMDAQRYADELRRAFEIEHQLVFVGISLVPDPNAPTPPPADDGSGGGPTPATSNGGLTTVKIVAIVICTVGTVAAVAFVAIWYHTRRKPIVVEGEFTDEYDSVGGGEVLVVEQPPGFRTTTLEGPSPYPVQHVQREVSEQSQTMAPTEDTIPDTDATDCDEKVQYARENSLHIGIPVETEGEVSSSAGGDDEFGYYSDDEYSEIISSSHQPSLTGFALKISEIED